MTQAEQAMIDRIVTSVAEGLGQDRRQVRYLVEAAMSEQPPTERPTVRMRWVAQIYSGRRKSSARIVHSVDESKTNGYALIGDFLDDMKQVDVQVGSIVAHQLWSGSVKNAKRQWQWGRVDADGEIVWDSKTYDQTDFLDFRDAVAAVI